MRTLGGACVRNAPQSVLSIGGCCIRSVLTVGRCLNSKGRAPLVLGLGAGPVAGVTPAR